jgi:hypothetical protein
MRWLLCIVGAIILLLPVTSAAHRLDEYLEATLLSVEPDRIEASMRLVPGVAVSSAVIASIDTSRDGVLSEAEQQAYAQRVSRDLSLSVDGRPLVLHVVSATFPSLEDMKQGTGEIQLELAAELPRGAADRRLRFENHHQSAIAVYLVNCLVPHDKNVRITAQSRSENQSVYQLDFVQVGRGEGVAPALWIAAGFLLLALLRWRRGDSLSEGWTLRRRPPALPRPRSATETTATSRSAGKPAPPPETCRP